MSAMESRIKIEQLQPGLFIRIEASWFSHPFLFGKFKLKNEEQIQTLRKLGIDEVYYIPEKSDCLPKPLDNPAARKEQEKPPPGLQQDPVMQLLWRIKRDRIEKLKEKHESIRRCTRSYSNTIRRVPAMMSNILTGCAEAVRDAQEVVSGMVNVFLADTDATVHLINIKEKEESIYHHSLNVSVLALTIGKKAGLAVHELNCLGIGALFHDVGKSRIDRKILRKPPPLTRPELELLQLHPRYGAEIVGQSGEFPPEAVQIILQHHEQVNGMGYPQRLSRQEISLPARITAIADEYDNLCNHVDPEKSLTPYQALSYMYTKRQDRLDMDLLSTFIRSLGIYPPGTVVRLSNGMYGVVISINPENPLKPSLMLYDADVPRSEALIFEMEDDLDVSIEKSIQPERLDPEVRAYLSPRTHLTYFVDDKSGKKTQ